MEQPVIERPLNTVQDAAEVLERQIARCHDLLRLLGAERAAMEHDDSTGLDRCIAEKDTLLQALVVDENRLQPFRRAVVSAVRNVPDVTAWRGRHETLTALMREAASMQKSNEALLAQRMDAVRGKLRTMSQGRETLTAYGASCQGRAYQHVPRFIDRSR